MGTISYSMLSRKESKHTTHITSIEEFKTNISFEGKVEKNNRAGFIPAVFKEKRDIENIISYSMLVLDVDKVEEKGLIKEEVVSQLLNLGCVSFIYPTSSHSPSLTKLRCIIFLKEPATKEQYRTGSINFIGSLGAKLLPALDVVATTRLNGMFYCHYKADGGMIDNHEKAIPLDISLFCSKQTVEKKASNCLEKLINNSPLNISLEEIKTTLDNISPEVDYHSWLKVGMAIHHQFKGSSEGFNFFNEWSIKDTRINQYPGERELKKIYKSFKNTKDNPVTFASVKAINNKQKIAKTTEATEDITLKKIDIYSYPSLIITYTKKGGEKIKVPTDLHNFEYLLNFYNIKLAHDVINKVNFANFNGQKTYEGNSLTTKIKSLLLSNNLDIGVVREYIDEISEKNYFNSFKEDVVLSKPWDGIKRIKKLIESIFVLEGYVEIRDKWVVFWLYELVKITCFNMDFEKPKNSRFVLVFQGEQYRGKTEWFRHLIPSNCQSRFFLEGHALDTNNDMSKLKCLEKVIVELGELGSTFKKSDIDGLKAFISSPKDSINLKYITKPKTYIRTTLFCATINDELFLNDETGNSRFLVVPIIKCNAFHNVDMQQVYAEIYQNIKENGFLEFTQEDLILLQKKNKSYEYECPIKIQFENTYDIANEKRELANNCTEILFNLGYNKEFAIKNRKYQSTIKKICKGFGYHFNTKDSRFILPPLKNKF